MASSSASSSASRPAFIDIGVNLDDDMFHGKYHGSQKHQGDLDNVIFRAKEAGVIRQIVTVGQISELPSAIALCQSNPGYLYCTLGVHPTRTSQLKGGGGDESYLEEIRLKLQKDQGTSSPMIVAIGECGLDYDRLHFSNKEDQVKHFDLQLQLAIDYRLPLFLHCRNAHQDFLSVIKPKVDEIAKALSSTTIATTPSSLDEVEGKKVIKRIGVVHCFTGSVEEMHELITLGFHIGLTGCSLKDEEGIRVASQIPLTSLLLETDAPWCDMRPTHASSPYWKEFVTEQSSALAKIYQPESTKNTKWEPHKTIKSRNEPCAIGCVAAVIAQIKGIPIEQVAQAALNNTRFLFNI